MAEDKIVIEGTAYPMPGNFTIGEARVLKQYTDLNLAEVETADTSDPNFMAAIIHIAFARANPATSFAHIEKVVNNIEIEKIDVEEAEVEADPPAPAPSPANGANESSSGENGASDSAPTPETSSLAATGARP